MEQEMRPYYAPGYSGHNSIKTIMLTGGFIAIKSN